MILRTFVLCATMTGCDHVAGQLTALALGDSTAQAISTAEVIAAPQLQADKTSRELGRFLDALRQVETGGQPNEGRGAKGDNGKSLGPLQIQKAYWLDARMPDGKWEDCLTDIGYSRRVVLAYARRYAPRALDASDWETLARVHNGGPKGASKKATLGYWAKVQKEMAK